jgi:hypothetical protein
VSSTHILWEEEVSFELKLIGLSVVTFSVCAWIFFLLFLESCYAIEALVNMTSFFITLIQFSDKKTWMENSLCIGHRWDS